MFIILLIKTKLQYDKLNFVNLITFNSIINWANIEMFTSLPYWDIYYF